jgi:hypothetical protein
LTEYSKNWSAASCGNDAQRGAPFVYDEPELKKEPATVSNRGELSSEAKQRYCYQLGLSRAYKILTA